MSSCFSGFKFRMVGFRVYGFGVCIGLRRALNLNAARHRLNSVLSPPIPSPRETSEPLAGGADPFAADKGARSMYSGWPISRQHPFLPRVVSLSWGRSTARRPSVCSTSASRRKVFERPILLKKALVHGLQDHAR